jgi:hypothetical protein
MIRLPLNHPLANAPDDIIAIFVIGHSLNFEIANPLLGARLGKLADDGDKKALAIVNIADYLKINRQQFELDLKSGVCIPETLEEVAGRLITVAVRSGQLNKKMVDVLFGVGLIGKGERDLIVSRNRLAA